MKRIITTVLMACALSAVDAQGLVSQTFGTVNNVDAWIGNNGTFFHNINGPGYEVPRESGTGVISFMNIMAIGEDVNGQLRGGITGYPFSDFFPGCIADDYQDEEYADRFTISLWWILRGTIEHHIAHWQDSGYVAHPAIRNWPCNGNTANGEAAILAPFHDNDGNGLYEPGHGDYPLIRGDEALYTILNDRAGLHPSGSDPAGMEIHLMFYQYSTNDALNNTTFIHAEVINRGTQTLSDFSFGSYIDFDLGNLEDDFLGTASGENMAYVYNADLIDNGHYGLTPPAAGVVLLNKPLYAHVSENISINDLNGYNIQHLFNGRLAYGSIQVDHEGEPFMHFCPGMRDQGWTESTQGNVPGDRKSVVSFPPEDWFGPGDVLCYDYAVVYAENSVENDIYAPVDSLIAVAEFVRGFFDEQHFDCFAEYVSTDEQQLEQLSVFPNPAQTFLNVSAEENTSFAILTLDGKEVKSGKINHATIPVDDLPNGCYLLRLSEGVVRFIKQD